MTPDPRVIFPLSLPLSVLVNLGLCGETGTGSCLANPNLMQENIRRQDFFGFPQGGKRAVHHFPTARESHQRNSAPPHRTLNDGTAVRPKTATLEGSVARRPPPPIADCDVDVAISNWPASSAVLPAQKSYTQIYIHCRKNTACVGMLNKEETLK